MGATVKYPTEFLENISSLEDGFESTAEEALAAAGEVTRDKMVERMQAALLPDERSTGELARSLGVSPMGIDRNGNYDVKVGFAEVRPDGEVNAKLANIIEHGSRANNRPPRPFLKPTRNAARKPAIAAMTARFERWTKENGAK